MVKVEAPIEFTCWETGETFEQNEFHVWNGDYGIVFAAECPFGCTTRHTVEK